MEKKFRLEAFLKKYNGMARTVRVASTVRGQLYNRTMDKRCSLTANDMMRKYGYIGAGSAVDISPTYDWNKETIEALNL